MIKRFYKKYTSRYFSYIKIFGIYIYKKRKNELEKIENILFFKKVQNAENTEYYIFDCLVYRKKTKLSFLTLVSELKTLNDKKIDFLSEEIFFLNKMNSYHSKFNSFLHKDINSIVIVGCGPTALNHKSLIKDSFYIAINGAIKYDWIKFSAVFIEEHKGKKLTEKVLNYKNCYKFFGKKIPPLNHVRQTELSEADFIPNYVYSSPDVYIYFLKKYSYDYWADDIVNEPISYKNASTFSALQFACFLHPKKIYIVGCDCTLPSENNAEIFGNSVTNICHWLSFADFIKRKYPDIEVTSINPVELKGVFNDVYTQPDVLTN